MIRNRPLEVMRLAGVVLAIALAALIWAAALFVVTHFVAKFW